MSLSYLEFIELLTSETEEKPKTVNQKSLLKMKVMFLKGFVAARRIVVY